MTALRKHRTPGDRHRFRLSDVSRRINADPASHRHFFNVEGNSLRLHVDPAVQRLPNGKVTIGIRPRALMPVKDAAPDALTSRAELIEPMGAETLVHARTGTGCDIRVVVPREARVKSGETLHLRTDESQVHVFDAGGRAVRT